MMRQILFRARCDYDEAGITAPYLLLTLTEEGVQRLKDLVKLAKDFGATVKSTLAGGTDFSANAAVFETDALRDVEGCKAEWLKPTAAWAVEFEERLGDNNWTVTPEGGPYEVKGAIRTELDFIKVFTRTGILRFVANPDDTDLQMWAGDLYPQDLEKL